MSRIVNPAENEIEFEKGRECKSRPTGTLVRKKNLRALSGATVTNTPSTIDDLSYTYTSNTNSMLKVEDASTAEGFNNGALNGSSEYAYNTDGSMTKDDNKGISSITYNFLGKPQNKGMRQKVQK